MIEEFVKDASKRNYVDKFIIEDISFNMQFLLLKVFLIKLKKETSKGKF
jgi:hypothetical protein